jgi:chromosome segregation ATPase
MTVDGGHVVVELARPADDISAAGGAWTAASGATAALGLLGLAMVAIAGRTARRARSRATSLYEPAIPRRRTLDAASGTTARLGTSQVDDPATLAERLRAAGARADAAEESLRTVQAQLKQTLTYVGELEGRIGMEDERWAVTDREVKALRSQVSDTAERLHAAETDNDALRERLTVRQRELDDARHELALARFSVDELDDLRARLDTAEATAGALERELHRVEAELELTNDRFHMTKLAEALRELDEEDADVSIAMGDEEDDTLIARRDPRLPTGRTR